MLRTLLNPRDKETGIFNSLRGLFASPFRYIQFDGVRRLRQVLATLLISTLFIVYMFQPFLNEVYHLRNLAIHIALDQGIEKAAVDGRFTDANINEMKMTLVDNLHYAAEDIVFTGTTGLTPRGDYIEGTLGVPAGQLWILPGILGGPNDVRQLRAYAKQMSEYIER